MMGLWSDPARPKSFHERRADPGRVAAVQRIESWTRERFTLAAADIVLVSEDRTDTPGFPPLETRVHFRMGDGPVHHFRVFKPLTEVAEADVPPAWMREALARESPDCNCC